MRQNSAVYAMIVAGKRKQIPFSASKKTSNTESIALIGVKNAERVKITFLFLES
jgi:hypothetical protein